MAKSISRLKRKVKSNHGLTAITALVALGVIIMLILILISGYFEHLKRAKRLFDQEQVGEATKYAKVQFMQDGFPTEGVTYYYDALHEDLVDANASMYIEGYGRTLEEDNRQAETGAPGIPNRGGKNGGQILAISVDDGGDTITVRWQGNRLTDYDYLLMTDAERLRLTDKQKDQIETDRRLKEEEKNQ